MPGEHPGGEGPPLQAAPTGRWSRRAALRVGASAATVLGSGVPILTRPTLQALADDGADAITFAVQDVTLIDGTGQPPLPHQTVLLSGDHIAAVVPGPVALPEGMPGVDGTGLTLLPGLIDTHIHWEDWMAPLFLRYGVTTVRDVGNFLAYILDVRQRERRGALKGPRLVAYGPLIDGSPPVNPSVSMMPTSVDNARTVAEHLIENGLDGLKVYANLPADHIRALTDVATAHGLPVAAHVGVASAREAVEAGVRSIEHVYGVLTRETPASLTELPQRMVDRGVFISATLLLQENLAHFAAVATPSYPHLDLVPPTIAQEWLAGQQRYGIPMIPLMLDAQGVAAYQQGVDRREAFLAQFYDIGGQITTGTDTPIPPFVIPGVSLHQEMQRLVAAGLRPLDALKAATGTAAALLRRPDLGVIAPGKLADLLLVAGNPADDIAATQNIQVVVKGGQVVYQAPPDPNGA